ncbi:MAG: hypothetical protein L6R40_006800 [Gallowayella cf. fulva]|nr:MAG: hypothetical protein L6R40_006800 [Xanthomendoza cf. fulva]
MLPTYTHLLVSALIPIYAGAHASLTRPSSAAKSEKSSKKQAVQDDYTEVEAEEEVESHIEGLTASDAIWFPLLAGCTLGGLYLIIKWLGDPTLLNTILNWYFAIFGLVGVAKMFKDSLDVMVSYIFPSMYFRDGQVWKFNESEGTAISRTDPSRTEKSPLPGCLRNLPLPKTFSRLLWTLRSTRSTLCIRTNFRRHGKTHIHLPPTTIFSILVALTVVLYYNLIARPWYLTNILGFAFAYNALQLISPSTSWTGSLILASLFCYDIYFVFFTPLMVTVATKLDIPAKLLFPRPSSPESPKRQLSMLGLGDVVLPGMMIGFALRLDLYLHYLRKQTTRTLGDSNAFTSDSALEDTESTLFTKVSTSSNGDSQPPSSTKSSFPTPSTAEIQANPTAYTPTPSKPGSITIKPHFHPATGNWGTRFWLSSSPNIDPSIQGTLFPKPYFHASLIGYVVGMMSTLGVMQVTGHAQPALFYLVPCVLVGFWGCAVVRGEVKEVWLFDEREEKGEEGKENKKEAEVKTEKVGEKDDEDSKLERKGGKEAEAKTDNARKGSQGRKKKPTPGHFLDLKMAFTRSKGTKACELTRRVKPTGRIRKRDHVMKDTEAGPGKGTEEQGAVETDQVEVPDTDEGTGSDRKV